MAPRIYGASVKGVDYPKLTWQFVIGDLDGDDDADLPAFAVFAAC